MPPTPQRGRVLLCACIPKTDLSCRGGSAVRVCHCPNILGTLSDFRRNAQLAARRPVRPWPRPSPATRCPPAGQTGRAAAAPPPVARITTSPRPVNTIAATLRGSVPALISAVQSSVPRLGSAGWGAGLAREAATGGPPGRLPGRAPSPANRSPGWLLRHERKTRRLALAGWLIDSPQASREIRLQFLEPRV